MNILGLQQHWWYGVVSAGLQELRPAPAAAGPPAVVGEEVPPPRGRKVAGAAPVQGLAVPAEAAVSAPAAVAPAATVAATPAATVPTGTGPAVVVSAAGAGRCGSGGADRCRRCRVRASGVAQCRS